jgi:hypothetical protein
MNKENFKKIADTKLKSENIDLAIFVVMLAKTIDIKYIDVNDWGCNLSPAVYVHNKHNMFKMARYTTYRKGNLDKALRFYNKGEL